MAEPAVTYTFVNGNTADGGEVNTNFTDVLNALTDGTSDFSIGSLIIASSLAVGTTSTFTGAATFETSKHVNLLLEDPGVGTNTITLQAPSGLSASYTLTLPPDDGVNGEVLSTDGSGVLSWQASTAPNATLSVQTADYVILDDDGFRTVSVTAGATDRTVTLPTLADNTNRIITIVKGDSGAGTVTVDGESTETIGGVATRVLSSENSSITIQAGPTEWEILGSNVIRRYGRKFLSADLTSSDNGDVAGLSFTGLTAGQEYEVFLNVFSTHAAGDAVQLIAYNGASGGGVIVARYNATATTAGYTYQSTAYGRFVASGTSMVVAAASITSTSVINGDGTQAETNVVLREVINELGTLT